MQADWDRWDRLARELACPRCGATYEGWGGCVSFADPNEPLISECPVMKCSHCGASATVIEKEGGPRIVDVCG